MWKLIVEDVLGDLSQIFDGLGYFVLFVVEVQRELEFFFAGLVQMYKEMLVYLRCLRKIVEPRTKIAFSWHHKVCLRDFNR